MIKLWIKCGLMGRICLGSFLGKIVTYLCMSPITYMAKFYGRGWSVFICGLAWFSLYLFITM